MDSFDSSWALVVHSLGLLDHCWLHLEPIWSQSGPIEGPQGPMDLDLEPSLALGALLTRLGAQNHNVSWRKRVFFTYGQYL